MSISVTPMTDLFGAEVTGVDLSGPVSDDDAETLRAALRDHLVIVVRDQNLSPSQYLEATKVFGSPVEQHLSKLLMEDHPEIAVLDSRVANTKKDGKIFPIGSKAWHTDHTNHAKPPNMTVLYGVKLPAQGGDTGFANMHAAFDKLDVDEQAELAKLKTVNVIEQQADYIDDETRRTHTAAPQTHPFIRTHPETGKKAIYVHPGKLAHFEGWEAEASKDMLKQLLERVLTDDITYRHKWRPGDMVIWDNRSLMHVAHSDYDPSEGRILHRIILEGEVPA